MNRSRRALTVAAVALMTLAAVPASGQAWRGVPIDSLATGFGLLAGFPDGWDSYGVEAFKGFGIVTAGLEYNLDSFEGSTPSQHTVRLNLAVPLPLGTEPMGLFVAPVASVGYSSWDDLSTIQIPVGASVMYKLGLGQGLSVVPYAVPQFFWTRMSYDGTSSSSSDFGWKAGGNLVVNNLIFGASYQKIADSDGWVGINVGFLLR